MFFSHPHSLCSNDSWWKIDSHIPIFSQHAQHKQKSKHIPSHFRIAPHIATHRRKRFWCIAMLACVVKKKEKQFSPFPADSSKRKHQKGNSKQKKKLTREWKIQFNQSIDDDYRARLTCFVLVLVFFFLYLNVFECSCGAIFPQVVMDWTTLPLLRGRPWFVGWAKLKNK